MWRIGFAADLFDQFQPRQSQLRLGLLPACCRKTYRSIDGGGIGALAYAEAVAMYLGATISKITSYHCTAGCVENA